MRAETTFSNKVDDIKEMYNDAMTVLKGFDEQLKDVEKFLDMLFEEPHLSQYFRTELVELRCKICPITDCSTKNDRNECLRINGNKATSEVKQNEP